MYLGYNFKRFMYFNFKVFQNYCLTRQCTKIGRTIESNKEFSRKIYLEFGRNTTDESKDCKRSKTDFLDLI